ncbi:MAG: hypothetical protein QT05_C0048G0046 [archaeon GW2011_AR13]|nr:MAG: hypothetical protein QT05_C0048G0046 [archaeon GW2011_AR13]HIG94129.1 hypothetical protein [Nanoarchaeota archaeon]HIH63942.1 hypothetical protein [Nanoarchaeota archaeon]HIJ09716.1 hypothetical protein [Nanoarchaeota archaeon]
MKLKNIILSTLLGASIFLPNNSFSKNLEYSKKIRNMNYEEVIKEIKTPKEATKYLTEFLSYKTDKEQYGEKNIYLSFKHIHKNEIDDCNGGALTAAALLSDDGYEPLVLTMLEKGGEKPNPSMGHIIFIYKKENKWGTLGINPSDCQEPKYSSIEEIVQRYNFITYFIKNIKEEYPDYIDNDINMRQKLLDTGQPIKTSNEKTLEEKFFGFGIK